MNAPESGAGKRVTIFVEGESEKKYLAKLLSADHIVMSPEAQIEGWAGAADAGPGGDVWPADTVASRFLARWLSRFRNDRGVPVRLAGWGGDALTGLAGALAGPRYAHLRDAWRADLYGDPGNGGLPPVRRLLLASGFVVAAIRCRVGYLADLAWRPVDRLLASRGAASMVMIAPVVIAVAMVVSHEGMYGLVANAENLAVLGGLPCVAIKAGRRYRQADPPKRTRREVPRSGGES